MGFALWIDSDAEMVWAEGTHEYRPMGTGAIARTGQFRHGDFMQVRKRPARLEESFVGFYGSLEEVNACLRTRAEWTLRRTPGHLR